MTNIIIKQSTNDFDYELLNLQIAAMKYMLDCEDFSSKTFNSMLDDIIAFQDDDGSFKLFDSYQLPSEERVLYIYNPTYLCTAALVKCVLKGNDEQREKAQKALPKALEFCCSRKFKGHGIYDFKGVLETLIIFTKCDIEKYMVNYLPEDNCFRQLMEEAKEVIFKMYKNSDFYSGYGQSYEAEMERIIYYFYDLQGRKW